MSSINSLSKDPLTNIFSYFGAKDLCKIRSTCRTWDKIICSENSLWKRLADTIKTQPSFNTDETYYSNVRKYCIAASSFFFGGSKEVLKDMENNNMVAIFNCLKSQRVFLQNELDTALENDCEEEIPRILEKIAFINCSRDFCVFYLRGALTLAFRNNLSKIPNILKWLSLLKIAPGIEEFFEAIKYTPQHVMPMFESIERFEPEMFKKFSLGWCHTVFLHHPEYVPLILSGIEEGGCVSFDEDMITLASTYCPQHIPAVLNIMEKSGQQPREAIFNTLIKSCPQFTSFVLEVMERKKIVPSDYMLYLVCSCCSDQVPKIITMMKNANYLPQKYAIEEVAKFCPQHGDQAQALLETSAV